LQLSTASVTNNYNWVLPGQ